MNNFERLVTTLIENENIFLSLDQIATLYLNRSKVANREPTYIYYEKTLKYIISFLKSIGIGTSDLVTHDSIFLYISYERKRGIKNISINKRISALKQALTYCYDRKYISENKLSNFRSLDETRKEIQIIDEKILKRIFKYLKVNSHLIEVIRARAIIYTLLDTGVRKNELRNLRKSNLDLENNTLYLDFTKTKEDRTVFISDNTIEILRRYIEVINPQDYLFTTLDGKRQISSKSLDRMIAKIKKKLNLSDKISISFHKFRHTYATMCYNNGADLEFIRNTLGHCNLIVTERYLHKPKNLMLQDHRKYAPVSHIEI